MPLVLVTNMGDMVDIELESRQWLNILMNVKVTICDV